jgi:hypothetical protein
MKYVLAGDNEDENLSCQSDPNSDLLPILLQNDCSARKPLRTDNMISLVQSKSNEIRAKRPLWQGTNAKGSPFWRLVEGDRNIDNFGLHTDAFSANVMPVESTQNE